MNKYIRNEKDIGTQKTICERFDPDCEITWCVTGQVVESGISSFPLANGERASQQIEFLRTQHHGTYLFLDGQSEVCDKSELEAPYHETMTHLPLIEHPQPCHALVLGGGDGAVVREVLKHDCVETCVLVEIDSNVVELCKQHIPDCAQAFLRDDPRLQLQYEDCLSYLQNTIAPQTFDIIISDLPEIIGEEQKAVRGRLYNREFYASVFRALKADGILMIHIGCLLHTETATNTQVYEDISSVFSNRRLLCTYLPMFSLEWLFCVASKESKHQWNMLSQAQRERQQRLSQQTVIYDDELHQGLFRYNRRIRSVMI